MLVSAATGEGIDGLLVAVEDRLAFAHEIMDVTLPAAAGKLAHWLHQNAEIISRQTTDTGDTMYQVRVDASARARLEAQLRRMT